LFVDFAIFSFRAVGLWLFLCELLARKFGSVSGCGFFAAEVNGYLVLV
jgi:hypothetical protein